MHENLIGFESVSDIEEQFAEHGCLGGCTVLFAYYSYEDYSGLSLVVFSKNGLLYEVNGSHCSCNGLEGQWNPEETTFAFLEFRLDSESYIFRDSEDALATLKRVIIDHTTNKILLGDDSLGGFSE